GSGRWPGGDGARRRLQFLEPMTASLLANGHAAGPFGLAGGQPGQPGAARVLRADGRVEPLAACAAVEMAPGDALEIDTPGGGGWGASEQGEGP
ncbi:MAG: hypothetical protein E6Q67_04755, partial [Roseateles sp.]